MQSLCNLNLLLRETDNVYAGVGVQVGAATEVAGAATEVVGAATVEDIVGKRAEAADAAAVNPI